ncbi:hypothetical protein PIROE2DRAFT_57487 [Piromyces sp. E2]|nr:hypothetical protein PIROE2DRAFT_57487 [Piromyces sp. E2]|eukprot:OUM69265.1 hypothetical protein PIROE2DRAFT_57487 [Piromyces sp. E2]
METTSILIPSNTSINKINKNQEVQKEEIKEEKNDESIKEEIQKNEYENFHLANLYEQTSQYRHWLFTKEELKEIREEVNEEAIKQIKENIQKEWAFLNGPDKDTVNLEDNSQRKLQLTFKGSYDYALISLYGDLVFIYWPSQIALACLMVASKNNGFSEDLESYIENLVKDQTTEKAEEFRKNLSDIENAIVQYTKIEKSVAISIERKRKSCQDPAFNPKSILHQKQIEMEKTEKELRRQKKIKLMNERDLQDDIFMTNPKINKDVIVNIDDDDDD